MQQMILDYLGCVRRKLKKLKGDEKHLRDSETPDWQAVGFLFHCCYKQNFKAPRSLMCEQSFSLESKTSALFFYE